METITMTTAVVLETYTNLKEFEAKDINLSVQFAWDLEDNMDELEKICKKFEEHRHKIFMSMVDEGIATEKDGVFTCVEGKEDDFVVKTNSVNELLKTTNEVKIKKCDFSSLPSEISPKDLKALKFMITRNEG